MNLTPLQLVLIAIVIMFLCFLLKHLVEADITPRCDNRIGILQSTCNQESNYANCLTCFTMNAKSACGDIPADDDNEVNQKIQGLCQKQHPKTPPPSPKPSPPPPSPPPPPPSPPPPPPSPPPSPKPSPPPPSPPPTPPPSGPTPKPPSPSPSPPAPKLPTCNCQSDLPYYSCGTGGMICNRRVCNTIDTNNGNEICTCPLGYKQKSNECVPENLMCDDKHCYPFL